MSELVTNALIHTRNGAVVTATATPARIRVEVQDFASEDLPAPYVPNADDGTHGRELVLVRSLADAWGVETPTPRQGRLVRTARRKALRDVRRRKAKKRRCGGRPLRVFRRTTCSAELLLQILEFLFQRVEPGERLGVVLRGEVDGPRVTSGFDAFRPFEPVPSACFGPTACRDGRGRRGS
ncbi:hypothetical protein SCALM49S_02163 [Streptomyces californicus]